MALNKPDPHTPDRLREEPPADRFCDVVMNGGVASGVVYPWALLKLATHYRFKSIGGNSVGAMAAALAAAAEYGRCCGVENAFEPLRRMPLNLAEREHESLKHESQRGRTKMLRLFQPSAPVRRLFDLFLILVQQPTPPSDQVVEEAARPQSPPADQSPKTAPAPKASQPWAVVFKVLTLYGFWWPLFLSWLLVLAAGMRVQTATGAVLMIFSLGGIVVLASSWVAYRFYRDLVALSHNHYGLCTGRGQEPGEEGLMEWLHRGIQLSAGRGEQDPPLTFANLWSAPRLGRAGPGPLPDGTMPPEPGVNLQMFTSNVTQGRPVRLPLNDPNTRLYFDPTEWCHYFPDYLIDALVNVSAPYRPASSSDPDPALEPDSRQSALMQRLRELPGADMPIVVAARLSMCFPILFSCVKVYAVDYEAPGGKRQLRSCLLSDGGLCTNFPVHLFDAAHPRWPTFALLLDSRLTKYGNEPVWLPETHLEGRGDNWQRGVPGAENDAQPERSVLMKLLGLAGGMLLTLKDWNDRTTGRLPQVRNRMIRMALRPGEGQLNLTMSSATILRMAHEYGTRAGEKLVEQFAPEGDGKQRAWREHLYVRSMVELRALRQHLRGYAQSLRAQGSTIPLRRILDSALTARPLAARDKTPRDAPAGTPRLFIYEATGEPLLTDQRAALEQAIQAVEALEQALSGRDDRFGPYQPVAEPELRLRPPL